MPGPTPIPLIERLLARILPEPNTGCWLWEGSANHKGYGQIGVGARGMTTTHRTAYKHFKGEIPDGMQVLHRCDVPSCCNPDHLWLGTHQDNVDDKMRKGRHVAGHSEMRGATNGNSKLTAESVHHILKREMTGKNYAALYDVSRATISQILTRRTWRHLSE
jgi:hypothetical protein